FKTLLGEARLKLSADPSMAESIFDYLKGGLVTESVAFADPTLQRRHFQMLGYVLRFQREGPPTADLKLAVRSTLALQLEEEVRGNLAKYEYLASRNWNRQKVSSLRARASGDFEKVLTIVDFDIRRIDID